MPERRFEIVDFPYCADAEPLFASIRHLPNAVWLDSGKPRSLDGRFDIISAAPLKMLETRGSETLITENGTTHTSSDDPFALAEQLWNELEKAPATLHNQPFLGGLIGFWGYDLGRRIESLPEDNPAVTNIPDMRLGQYVWALVQNHSSQKAWLFFHPQCPKSLRKQVQVLLEASELQQKNTTEPDFTLTRSFQPTRTKQQHCDAVREIQDYIRAGDCYQVNLAQHFSAEFEGDSWQIYKQLRQVLPSPYSAYMRWGNDLTESQAVMCLSPERFLKLSLNQIEAKPIKGTIKRGSTLEEDNQNAISLMNSAKNRAENLMIVDLLRNDLGKTCEPGSIHVPKLFALESFPNVHHLVSTITSTLAENETPFSLLRGCFPGGSITGAPKKRAMEIIEELESCRRNLYCGSIGYISTTGRMDTNIAIRTVLADGNKLHCWGGGGIVADSDPESEYQESLDKIQVLMEALGSRF